MRPPPLGAAPAKRGTLDISLCFFLLLGAEVRDGVKAESCQRLLYEESDGGRYDGRRVNW